MDITDIEKRVDKVLSELYFNWVMNDDPDVWEESCRYVRTCGAKKCKKAFHQFKDTSSKTQETSVCLCRVWLYLAASSSLAEFQDFLKNFHVSGYVNEMKAVCFLLHEAHEKYLQALTGDEKAWDKFIITKRKWLKNTDFNTLDCHELTAIITKEEKKDENVFVPQGDMEIENNRLATFVNYKPPKGSVEPVALAKKGLVYTGIKTFVICYNCEQRTPIAENMEYNDKFHYNKCSMSSQQSQPRSSDDPSASIESTTSASRDPPLLSYSQEEINHLKVEILLKYVRVYISGPLNAAVKEMEASLFRKCKKVPILDEDVNAYFYNSKPSQSIGYQMIDTIVGKLKIYFKNVPKPEDIVKRSNPVEWTKPGGCWEICKIVMFSFPIRLLLPWQFDSSFKMDHVYDKAENFSVDALLKLLRNLNHQFKPLVKDLNKVDFAIQACSKLQKLIGMRNLPAHRASVSDEELEKCFQRVADLLWDDRFYKEAQKYSESMRVFDEVFALEKYNHEEFIQFFMSLLQIH